MTRRGTRLYFALPVADASRSTKPSVLCSSLTVEPRVLSERMADLAAASVHYKESRGIHSAALCDAQRLLIVAEDVARQNAPVVASRTSPTDMAVALALA
jgi:formate dehydrogenase assembly factor FdhD